MTAHSEGRRVVLIVDEAQTLSPELLEQVRLLTNLETSKQKLLQIILIGQPELRELLDRPRDAADRATHHGALSLGAAAKDDTRAYVTIGCAWPARRATSSRSAPSTRSIKHSRGIPRLINVIADRALLAAYTKTAAASMRDSSCAAANEVFGVRRRTPWWPVATATAGVAAVVFGVTNLGEPPRAPERRPEQFSVRRPGTGAPTATSTADSPAPNRRRKRPGADRACQHWSRRRSR